MCRYFENVWADTQRLNPRPVKFSKRAPWQFPRFEAWKRKEPPASSRRQCRCGRADAFKCYLRVQAKELMGESRR